MSNQNKSFRNEILDEIVRILEPYSITNVEAESLWRDVSGKLSEVVESLLGCDNPEELEQLKVKALAWVCVNKLVRVAGDGIIDIESFFSKLVDLMDEKYGESIL